MSSLGAILYCRSLDDIAVIWLSAIATNVCASYVCNNASGHLSCLWITTTLYYYKCIRLYELYGTFDICILVHVTQKGDLFPRKFCPLWDETLRFDSAKWIFGSFSVMILLNSVENYVNYWVSTYCIVDMAFHLVYTFLELCQVQLLLSSFV